MYHALLPLVYREQHLTLDSDIKPDNILLDRGGHVKLTDFGLSTTDLESSDMDCGSAPYMSFGKGLVIPPQRSLLLIPLGFAECRNNVAPTYSPRAADVWSLGIVLINMSVLWYRCPCSVLMGSTGCTTLILGPIQLKGPAPLLECTFAIPSTSSLLVSLA